MMKRATIVWILLAAASVGALFAVKYEVQALEEQLAATKRDVIENLEAVHVLKAEWAYLNQPTRLEDLGRRLLEMEPVSSDQVATIADIPLRTEALHEETPPPEATPAPVLPLLAGMDHTP